MAWLRTSGPALAPQVAKFGAVGFLAYVVDVAFFNALQYFGAQPLLADDPLRAKVISTAVATVVAWLGNRYWTFRRTRRREMRREFALFVVMCTIGLGISLSILWFSHYVLGLTSPLADNISANVIGLAAGATFRFWAYRRIVFVHHIRTPGGFAAADRTTTRDDSASLNPMVPVRDLSKAPLERVRE
jgi:putative flippase GtrA